MTVVLNGLTAYPLAKALGILAKNPSGLVVVGANELARGLGLAAEKRGFPVLLIDTNPDHCQAARQAGLRVIEGSVRDIELLTRHDLSGMGCLLAMTTSSSINCYSASFSAEAIGIERSFAVISPTTTAVERAHLKVAGTKIAFAGQIDLGATLHFLRRGLATFKESSWPIKEKNFDSRNFLPLLVVNNEGLSPCEFQSEVPPGSTVIGLSFTVPELEPLPFSLENPITDGFKPEVSSS
jgi:hypothetical protein